MSYSRYVEAFSQLTLPPVFRTAPQGPNLGSRDATFWTPWASQFLSAARLRIPPRLHGRRVFSLCSYSARNTFSGYFGMWRSETWKIFLQNHASGIGAMDFLIVPTIGFRLLFVLVILRHQRRRLISLSVTAIRRRSGALTRSPMPSRGMKRLST